MNWLRRLTRPNPPEAVKYLALIDKLRWVAFLTSVFFVLLEEIPFVKHHKILKAAVFWTFESILAVVIIGAIYALVRYLIAYAQGTR